METKPRALPNVGVLGPTTLVRDGRPVHLGALKPRALLAALALSAGHPLSVDELVDLVWGPNPPAGAPATLHGYIAELRRALEPERPPREQPRILRTAGRGYLLDLPQDHLDAGRLARLVLEAVEAGRVIPDADRPSARPEDVGVLVAALDQLDRAAALVRGPAYADLGESTRAASERSRIDDLLMTAAEHAAAYRLALGRDSEALVALRDLTAHNPLRERLWLLLALALARMGRQGDALTALRTLSERVADDLGLDPTPAVRRLQQDILHQATTLGLPSAPPPAKAPIGRQDALATLESCLDAARTGSGRMVWLTGEIGIGKTTLARALLARARSRGFVVAGVDPPASRDAPDGWAVTEAIGALCATGTAGDIPLSSPDAATSGFGLGERLVACVRTVGRKAPVALLVDDVEWTDAASVKALAHLADRLAGLPLCLVLTHGVGAQTILLRDLRHAATRADGVRMDLPRLGVADTEALVRQRGYLLPEEQWPALHRRADGNPRLALLLAETGNPAGPLPLPVLEYVSLQLAAVPDETIEVLRLMTLLGEPTETAELTRFLPADAVELGVGAGLTLGVLRRVAGGPLRVAHPLLAEQVVADTRPDAYERLRARVRLQQARMLRWAGRAAEADAAWDDAITSAELTRDTALLAAVAAGRDTGTVWHGRAYGDTHHGAVAALRRIIARTDDTGLRAEALAALATESYYAAPPAEIDAWVEEALALTEHHPDAALRLRVLGSALAARWRPETADWRAATATKMATLARSSFDAAAELVAEVHGVVTAADLGRVAEVDRTLPGLLHVARHDRGLALLPLLELMAASWAGMLGRHRQADAALARARALPEPGDGRLTEGVCLTTLLNAWWRGVREPAELACSAWAARREDAGPTANLRIALLLRLGRRDAARATAERAGVRVGGTTYLAPFDTALAAEIAHGLGDAELAGRAYAVLAPHAGHIASVGSLGHLGPVDCHLALAAATIGDADAARRHAADAGALISAWGATPVADWFAQARGARRE